MQIRIAGFEQDSIVDGVGMRFTLFTQGCPHHCPDCHNPQTHDFNGGYMCDTSEVLKIISLNPIISGVTLSGGEPFCQSSACLEIAKEAHKRNLDVWCYTGFSFEEIKDDPLLSEVDVLVDGKFISSLKTTNSPFKGSSNQRIIDVKASLNQGEVVLMF